MVFYFSGTGNSFSVAQKIAGKLNDKLVSVSDCLNKGELTFTLTDNESVGFIFPVYFYGVPSIVLDFIAKLDLKNYRNNYAYAAGTCGGKSGDMHAMLRRKLAGHGIRLNAVYDVFMPDNYILMFNLLTPAEKVTGILDAAETRIAEIVENIHSRKSIPIKSSIKRWFMTTFSYPVYKYGRSTRPFHVTADCNGCGLCARRCPCLMIEMQDKIPHWKKGKCTQCLACLHRCPHRAIEYGKKTQNRGRYVNPEAKGF